MSFLYSIIGFLILLGVLVFIHEWGHYAVARLFGIKVLRFSIGFGPVLWRRQWGETEWAISAVPLGGYVKMLDEREGVVSPQERHRAFNRQPPWKRIAVVAAGPLINLLFAWLLFTLVFLIGYSTLRPVLSTPEHPDQWWIVHSVDERPVFSMGDLQMALIERRLEDAGEASLSGNLWPAHSAYKKVLVLDGLGVDDNVLTWLEKNGHGPRMPPLEPVVGEVVTGSPAHQAGLRPGDRIVAIDGQPVRDWWELVEWIRAHAGKTGIITVMREGVPIDLNVTPAAHPEREGGYLGVGVDRHQQLPDAFVAHVRYGLLDAAILGWQRGWQFLTMTLEMMVKMVTGEAGLHNLSGPVSIAQFSGEALSLGWLNFIMLMGLISLSLGVLNLLPIPLLDGGHILFDLLEWISGRPLPEPVQEGAQKVGLAVLLMLTLLALSNDMIRLING